MPQVTDKPGELAEHPEDNRQPRTKAGQFADHTGENKRTRRTRATKHQIQRRLLTDLEHYGQAAIEDFRKRDPGGYLMFALDTLGISRQATRGNSGPAINITIKQSAPDQSPQDAPTGITIEATPDTSGALDHQPDAVTANLDQRDE